MNQNSTPYRGFVTGHVEERSVEEGRVVSHEVPSFDINLSNALSGCAHHEHRVLPFRILNYPDDKMQSYSTWTVGCRSSFLVLPESSSTGCPR